MNDVLLFWALCAVLASNMAVFVTMKFRHERTLRLRAIIINTLYEQCRKQERELQALRSSTTINTEETHTS